MTVWQEGEVVSRSAPGHAMVEVAGRRYLLQHNPEIDNHLSVGTILKVQTDKDYISAWAPAKEGGKR